MQHTFRSIFDALEMARVATWSAHDAGLSLEQAGSIEDELQTARNLVEVAQQRHQAMRAAVYQLLVDERTRNSYMPEMAIKLEPLPADTFLAKQLLAIIEADTVRVVPTDLPRVGSETEVAPTDPRSEPSPRTH
jgi:hypothetical protein